MLSEILKVENNREVQESKTEVVGPRKDNNSGRNGSFLHGWLPHRGKAQMACNYCFPMRTMF